MAKKTQKTGRKARLAAELRANLKRRKEKSREAKKMDAIAVASEGEAQGR